MKDLLTSRRFILTLTIIQLTMSMLISLAIIASTIRTFTLDTVKSIMVAYSKCITQNLNTLIVEHSDTANTSYFYILSNLLHTIREQNSDIVDISILKIYIVKNNDINKIIAISNSYENNSDYHIEFKNLTVSEKENVKRALSQKKYVFTKQYNTILNKNVYSLYYKYFTKDNIQYIIRIDTNTDKQEAIFATFSSQLNIVLTMELQFILLILFFLYI